MAEILAIEGNKVKIGVEGGKIVTVPIASINYASPSVGDSVKVFKDKDEYIVTKEKTIADDLVSNDGEGKRVNKHLFVWVFCFLLGGFGVDRFMRGQIGTGICKLLFSWLTLGIWELVDWIISLVKAYGSGNDDEYLKFDKSGAYIE